ncbi:unnamed protein product [Periconia digitata]|uniref:Myb-like DNA-binding domain-containing protein n=1 Tax=Periconia digitata TaxID=1303443 RepID=A0A9W4U5R3_9PLEO|nr:unnamed protein product [Periconia digitata]
MPTTEDNINFLYLIITEDDSPALDMDTIATKLGLNKAAASKRWSRLKGAMNAGENPGPNAYKFLWLALKHSQRSKVTCNETTTHFFAYQS